MSTEQSHHDTSLNNQPERDASKLANAGITSSSTGAIGNEKGAEGSTGSETEKSKAPVDKHGDTWGGGIPFENKQVK